MGKNHRIFLVLEAVVMLPCLSQCKKGYLGANMAFFESIFEMVGFNNKTPKHAPQCFRIGVFLLRMFE